jgi:hypothetical protein
MSEIIPRPPFTLLDQLENEAGEASSLLQQVLESELTKHGISSGTLLGEILDTHNPYLLGRVLVRWDDGERGPTEAWIRVVEGVRARAGTQVVLSRPANAGEWLVTAVLLGTRRDEGPTAGEGQEILRLEPGQVVRVEDHRGQAVVEISGDQSGPHVRLLGRDCTFGVDGKLRIEAREVELRGRDGVDLRSDGEVVARGRVIRLN